MRPRELGLIIGRLPAGPLDALTDVPGVRVGHTTLVRGDGPLVVGRGPVRTGVTIVVPHDGDTWREPIFAGCHRLNGNGELTGLEWVRESGLLGGAIGLTNTHSIGVVRDALVGEAARGRSPDEPFWSLPVVGETYDGGLNDINGFHVRRSDVERAISSASGGPVAEGNVGGGTGMICHEFKGGIGTASRVAPGAAGGWTVGALVQANYGSRELLRVDGVPVGEDIPTSEVPSPYDELERREREASGGGGADPAGGLATAADPGVGGADPGGGRATAADPGVGGADPGGGRATAADPGGRRGPGGGSIIVVLATDAPLLPHQCERLAQRAGLGLARMGSVGSHSSGDLFLAFATGNRGLSRSAGERDDRLTAPIEMVVDRHITALFQAAVEATEAAIVSALLAAETMTGRDGITAHALDPDRLLDVMARFGRGPRARHA